MIEKTMVPQLADLNLASSKFMLEKYSNYLEYLNDFVEQVETALEYRDTFFKNDSIKERIKFFNNIQKRIDKFSDDFVGYWYEVFKSSPDYIKTQVKVNSLLLESDSIGKFTNSLYLLDDSICPISDWSMNDAPPPNYIPYNTLNKLSPWTKQILSRASFRTNNMYRCNFVMVQPSDVSSKKAHGTNLVTDEFYYTRTASEIKKATTDKLLKMFQNEVKVLLRYCNVNDNEALNYLDFENNKSNIGVYSFKLDVEKVQYNVDILSNRIKFLKSRVLSDKVLGTEKITVIKPKNRTQEEYDKIYSQNIATFLDQLDPRKIFTSLSSTEKSKSKIETNVEEQSNINDAQSNVSNSEESSTNGKDSNPPAGLPAESTPTFTHYSSTIQYPTYQVPDWAEGISQCLGFGAALDAFNGIQDPLTIFNNTSSADFDLFSMLNQLNPFGIDATQFTSALNSLGFDINLQQIMDSITQLANGDLTGIADSFSSFLPIPGFDLGSFFDDPGKAGEQIEEALLQATQSVLKTIENTVLDLFNGLVCGAAQGGGFGNFSNLGSSLAGLGRSFGGFG